MKKVKMIWDFRGTQGYQTAQHHAHHLEEFLNLEGLEGSFSGAESLHPNHAIAFVVVPEERVKELRPRLKPHRGQWYTNNPE